AIRRGPTMAVARKMPAAFRIHPASTSHRGSASHDSSISHGLLSGTSIGWVVASIPFDIHLVLSTLRYSRKSPRIDAVGVFASPDWRHSERAHSTHTACCCPMSDILQQIVHTKRREVELR